LPRHEVSSGAEAIEKTAMVPAALDPALAGVIDLIDLPDEPIKSAPPGGGCWEWPLSRNERKVRVALVDQHLQRLDRQLIVDKLHEMQSGQSVTLR
jgi:hypothetical protein